MTSVFEIRLSKDQYRSIPADDRCLLFLSGYALNQITVLRKVVIFSLNHDPKSEIESMVCAGQSQVIYRLLLGVIEETWQMAKQQGKLIGTVYMQLLDPEARAAYSSLQKHFGGSNLLNKIRNTVIFHYPSPSQLNAAFEDVDSDDDNWCIYPSTGYSNSFYATSDTIVAAAIIRATGEQDPAAGWQKVIGAMVPVSNNLLDFFTALIKAIYIKHLGADALSDGRLQELNIDHEPKISDVSFPFFALDD